MKNDYKDEWLSLLLKQNFKEWRISAEANHIIIFIPNDQDLDEVMAGFQTTIKRLRTKIKSKPDKIGFFIGNNKDSRYWELC